MTTETRLFGKIDISEDRIITFTTGMMGFEDYKKYTLISDAENENGSIMWLQSLEEPELAFPVIDPVKIMPEYSPSVSDELLEPLGEADDEDFYILSVITVPSDLTKMTANLKAPVIINLKSMKGCQVIVNNDEYKVRYNVYDYVQKMKEGESN